ncbi:hypothetical protein A4X13_0g3981 [Tilletia indica]|uniref:Uncharacterized protein n=1 Tax=Tilletia indica TaxID=43049 RepID=A0A177TF20_9BASI|nr:hypothetical protein A4X13_0g3981 [Tilletia indica]
MLYSYPVLHTPRAVTLFTATLYADDTDIAHQVKTLTIRPVPRRNRSTLCAGAIDWLGRKCTHLLSICPNIRALSVWNPYIAGDVLNNVWNRLDSLTTLEIVGALDEQGTGTACTVRFPTYPVSVMWAVTQVFVTVPPHETAWQPAACREGCNHHENVYFVNDIDVDSVNGTADTPTSEEEDADADGHPQSEVENIVDTSSNASITSESDGTST